MGINDRDYVRREGPSFLGSIRRTRHDLQMAHRHQRRLSSFSSFSPATRRVNDPFTDALLLNVDKVVFHGEIWRLLTYAFLHDTRDFLHILFNMLLLWWFGSDIEDMYGPREFLAFYLVSAVVGGVAFTVVHLIDFSGDLCLGASGAVTAVLVLYAFPLSAAHHLSCSCSCRCRSGCSSSVRWRYDAYTLLSQQSEHGRRHGPPRRRGVRLRLLQAALADHSAALQACGRAFSPRAGGWSGLTCASTVRKRRNQFVRPSPLRWMRTASRSRWTRCWKRCRASAGRT